MAGNLVIIDENEISEDEEEEKPKGQGHTHGVKDNKEHVYRGLNATIVHSFCNSQLHELSEKYRCLVNREPSSGQPEKLTITETRQTFAEDVKRVQDEIDKKLQQIDKLSLSCSRRERWRVDEFVRKHLDDSTKRTELYVGEDEVTVIGERYDEVDKTLHSLKVHLGHVQRSNRAGRQISLDHISSENYEKDKQPYNRSTSSAYPQTSRSSGLPNNYDDDDDDDDNRVTTEVKLAKGFILKVYKASITRLDVDVIVNAANDNLMHGGGVARVISQAAGHKLDEESQNYIARHGLIKVTKNCETTAGRLNYKSVIHAVGPQWHEYRDKVKCLDDVYQTVYNVLKTCEKQRYHSVGIPAISAGIYGVPKVLCADMYVKAAADFSDKGSKWIKEMHFIDVDMEILKLVNKSIQKWKDDPKQINQKITVPEYLKSHQYQPSFTSHQGRRHGHGGQGERNFQGQAEELSGRHKPTYAHQNSWENGGIIENIDTNYLSRVVYIQKEKFRWGGVADTFMIQGAIQVKIFKGEIDKVRNLDALVCGIDKKLTSYSFVSKALENAGGNTYTKALSDMKKNILEQDKAVNKVFKSAGGKLGVKYVLHLMNERVKSASKEELKTFREGIYQVLHSAKKWKVETLAIPLIGTGEIQKEEVKLKRCCSALLHAICDFCSEEDEPSITEIHLINNASNVCEVMVDVFKQAETSGKSATNRTSTSSLGNSGLRNRSPEHSRGSGSDSRMSNKSPERSRESESYRSRDSGSNRDNERRQDRDGNRNSDRPLRRTYTAEGKQDDDDGRDGGETYEDMEVDNNDQTTNMGITRRGTGNLIILDDDDD